MPLVPKFQEVITHDLTSLTLGQTVQVKLPTLYHIESLKIRVAVTVSGVMATANADKILNLLKQVTVKRGGGQKTLIVSASGAGLIEFYANQVSHLDRNTLAAIGGNTATTYYITYPVYFAPPQLADPLKSYCCLPAPLMGKEPPVLELKFSAQSDMDLHASKTFAVSALSAAVVVNQRELPMDFPTVQAELIESEQEWTEVARKTYELPLGGEYSAILMRQYTSASARGDITSTGGELEIALARKTYRQVYPWVVTQENDESSYTGAENKFTADSSLYFDWLTDGISEVRELGSLLNANVGLMNGQNQAVQIIHDLNGASGKKIKYLYHRFFGDMRALKLG